MEAPYKGDGSPSSIPMPFLPLADGSLVDAPQELAEQPAGPPRVASLSPMAAAKTTLG